MKDFELAYEIVELKHMLHDQNQLLKQIAQSLREDNERKIEALMVVAEKTRSEQGDVSSSTDSRDNILEPVHSHGHFGCMR